MPGRLRQRWSALDIWQRWPVAVWAVIVLAAVARAALIEYPRHKGCYYLYGDAGRAWLAGLDLYTPRDGLDVFRYSPPVAAFFAPFGLLPDMAGSALLRALNCVVFLLGLSAWSRSGLPLEISPSRRALLFLLAVPLAARSLIDVQVNGLVIGLMLLGMAAVAANRWSWAAVAIALPCAIKGYPLALAFLLMAVHPRQFTPRFAAALLGCLALPFVLQRPAYVTHQYELWVRYGLNNRYYEALPFQDLRLLARALGSSLSHSTYFALQVAGGAVLAGLCLLMRWRRAPRANLYTTLFLLCCGWMMVLGPATEVCTHIVFAPAAAYLVLEAWVRRSAKVHRLAVCAAFGLFTIAQLALWFPGGSRINDLAPYTVATLLMMAALAAAEVQRWVVHPSDAPMQDPSLRRAA